MHPLTRPWTSLLLASLLAVSATAPARAAQDPRVEAGKAAALAKRPLADADIEKYCAVRADIRDLGTPANTAPALQKYAQDAKTIRAKHGITDSEYNVLLGRIMAAQMLVRMKMAVPTDKKADVEIVTKHWDKIQAAEGKKK